MDLSLQHPLNALLVGSSGAGKTFWMKRVVENRNRMFNVQFHEVIWHYCEWQPAYDALSKEGVQFVQGLPCMDDYPPKQPAKLVVIDDFMDELNNKEILKFFIKGSNHRNLSVFFLCQALYPPGLRQISLNSHYIIIFKTSRDLSQIRTFCMQMDPVHWRALLEAYTDATQQGHSYLLFDFKPKQIDHLRLRTHIFPGENTVVYIPKKKYKKDMVGLASSVE